MKIKLKGICVDINKPRNLSELLKLRVVCMTEYYTAKKAKRELLEMIIHIIDRKVELDYQVPQIESFINQ
jgi:hypothetical protein